LRFDLLYKTHVSQHKTEIKATPRTVPTPRPAFTLVDMPPSLDGADIPVLAGASEVGVDRVVAAEVGREVLGADAERKVLEAIDVAVTW
jgi:hypothetical protein